MSEAPDWGFDFTPEQIRDMREAVPELERCDDCGTAFGLRWSMKDELPLCEGCYGRRHGFSSASQKPGSNAGSTDIEGLPQVGPASSSGDPPQVTTQGGATTNVARSPNKPTRTRGVPGPTCGTPLGSSGTTSGIVGALPEDAKPDMRALADDFARHWGEWTSSGRTRPVAYATRFAARRLGWVSDGKLDHKRASRAIGKLVRAGLLVEGEPLPRVPGKAFGTKTYRPGRP